MSIADKKFVKMCQDIIKHGTSSEGEEVRPRWEDTGEPAHTTKLFGVANMYDLRKEFPALTLRKTGIKTAVTEILWIWQKHSNNIHDLNAHIWDAWADEDGSLGKTYGYQLGVKHQYPEGEMTQVDHVLWTLKNNPFDRHMIVTMYNPHDLHEMNLQPCLHTISFNVTKDKKGRKVLNTMLTQRSNDVLAANNWNLVQYAVLTMMFAQVCDMIPGQVFHTITDAHIYDRHIDLIKELIQREQFPAPKVRLNPDVKDFYDFTPEDVIIEDYQAGEQIKFPVAV